MKQQVLYVTAPFVDFCIVFASFEEGCLDADRSCATRVAIWCILPARRAGSFGLIHVYLPGALALLLLPVDEEGFGVDHVSDR